jgi:V8-like Glu-specific endopeptidase
MRASLLLLCALALASCSKQREEAQSLVHEISVASLEAAIEMADSAKIQCADSAACPENVGLFVGASGTSVSTCTAFLVGAGLVATNSHCIPSAVRMMPDLCAERVRVIFPKAGEKAEQSFACESLLGQSERPNEISPDLALFRVKSTGRNAIPVNRGGVKPDAAHTAYKMNPAEGASGTLVAQSCLSVPNTYRFPLYRSEEDSLFVTGDCPSIPGNSGAPLLNAEGQAVGIFQAELQLDGEQKKQWGPYLKEGETFAPLTLGTSLRCWKAEGWAWDETCAPVDPEEIVRPNIRDFLAGLEPRLAEIARAFENRVFRWKSVVSRRLLLENEYRLEPECIQPLESWAGPYVIVADPLILEEEARFSLPLPTLRASMRFNRYMQVDAAIDLEAPASREFVIHPAALARDGTDGTLGICPVTE